MVPIQIMINRLLATYSSSCYFKIKVVLPLLQNKLFDENKHSFKYEKGQNEINIYEKLEITPTTPLTTENKFQFFLEVYTKKGYKTAGVGIYHLAKGISENVPIQIEIKKCPLGKGILEIQFLNFSINPVNKINNMNVIPLGRKKSKGHNSPSPSKVSDNSFFPQKSEISDISYITNVTNILPVKPNNNLDSDRNGYNIIYTSPNSNINNLNNNDLLLKEKNRQIKELKTKIDYYNDENKELKNLVEDFKKEKKVIADEKNRVLMQQKELYQKIINEKEDLQTKNESLKQNINILNKNKLELEQKLSNIKYQTEKQIKDLMNQIQNFKNNKIQLDNEIKIKDERLIILDKKLKEMALNYQKKFSELKNNFYNEKNTNMVNYNQNLKTKEEEIMKLNVKIRSLEESIQILNEEKEINNQKKLENEESTKNKRKLLEQISSKDKQIFELKKELSELKNKMLSELNTRKTQSMLNGLTEKELKLKINELQNIIKQKDEEIMELQTKYDNIKYDSKRLKSKLTLAEIDEEENDKDNGSNLNFLNQINEIQKTYKEREEKLIKEKNEEIKKLRLRNQNLERESCLDNNKAIDIKKYLNEIKRLKNSNANLEEDLKYYKELNKKYIDSEKRKTIYESENLKLQNLLQKKKEEIEVIKINQKKLEEENKMLERQLVNSKGKLGEVLNELAEVESKCVFLEEEQRQMKKNGINGGRYDNN